MEKDFLTPVLDDIRNERKYQVEKWGNGSDDTRNTPWMWVAYIASYATKWMSGKFRVDSNDANAFREKMIKTAAIAVAAVESLDRQRSQTGKAFYEV